jgi:hypothetical protein
LAQEKIWTIDINQDLKKDIIKFAADANTANAEILTLQITYKEALGQMIYIGYQNSFLSSVDLADIVSKNGYFTLEYKVRDNNRKIFFDRYVTFKVVKENNDINVYLHKDGGTILKERPYKDNGVTVYLYDTIAEKVYAVKDFGKVKFEDFNPAKASFYYFAINYKK